MNSLHKAMIATVLVVASSSMAAASTADLTIFPSESSTEINSFTSYEVEVENIGPVKDVYTLSSQAKEVSIAPRKVELEPGQTKTVNVWYNPEVTKEEGTYSFTVTATSRANGKRYAVDGTVNIIKDHKVDVSVDSSSRTGCLGEKITYTVRVTNNGIQKETFSLETDYGSLSQDQVTLEEGETREITLTASSSKPTEQNFNVVAASTTSYAQDIENLDFKAEICYASDVSITPKQQNVAAYTEANYKVTVRNTGTKQDQFVLSTSRGTLKDTKITIGGKSSDSTTLTVTPETLGRQEVTVTAKSEVKSSETVIANVYNGMSSEVVFSQETKTVCENEEAKFDVTVRNTGKVEETFSISKSLGTISKDELELDPGESKEVEVTVNAASLVEGNTYDVTVTSKATTFGQPSSSSTSQLVVENCWDMQMNVVPKIASAGENRSVIYEIHTRNTGTMENTYRFSYQGPSWIEIRPDELEIAPGERKTTYMYAGLPFEKEGQVKINVTAKGNQVQESQTVDLIIGKDIREAVRSGRERVGGGLSGMLGDFSRSVTDASTVAKVIGSIIAGLIIVAVILIWEL